MAHYDSFAEASSSVGEAFAKANAPAKAPPAERARILLAALPATVRIGPHDYAIARFDGFGDGGSRYGSIDFLASVLRLSDHASPTNLADTFFHEVVHGIWRNAALEKESTEEVVAGAFGAGLVGLFRDNPWLAGWIAGAVK
jgi:hypothetical protein